MTWQQPWWAETNLPPVGCRCTDEDPYRLAWVSTSDGTMVHQCGQPSLATIRSQNMLNLFQGGAHHNELVETSDLTSKAEFTWVSDYSWTPELVVGSLTGRKARVWRANGHETGNVAT
jgi:hypothetical protein